LNKVRLIAIADEVETSSVWPSGADCATAFAASISEAPGRFSTITGLPRPCDSRSA
jgi:hypothetical protein